LVVASVHHQERPAGELTNSSTRIDEGAHDSLKGSLRRQVAAGGQNDRADCRVVGRYHDRQVGTQ